jgi:hypothetical protein
MALEADNDNRRWLTPPHSSDAALPDWMPDIERLKREAQLAKESGRPDPWSLAEAECWRDLIEAEIAAQTHRGAGGDIVQMLRIWKAELGTIIRTLNALDGRKSDRSEEPEQSIAA